MEYPKGFGTVVKDLSPNEKDPTKKSLYVIETDTNQRNFSIPPKIYGAFWSADGPAPVNEVAIKLWREFSNLPDFNMCGDGEGRENEINIDGSETAEGECHYGFATFNYGSIALSMYVTEVETAYDPRICRLHGLGLLRKALEMQGVCPCDKDYKKNLSEFSALPSQEGDADKRPPLEVFMDDPFKNMEVPFKDSDFGDIQQMEDFLNLIGKWSPEKRNESDVGKEYIVLKFFHPGPNFKPYREPWIKVTKFEIYGPCWKNCAGEKGFESRRYAVEYARYEIRRKSKFFKDYFVSCPDNASSDGPWDSSEMEDASDVLHLHTFDDDHYYSCRVEVVTKEEFYCFLNNHRIKWLGTPSPMYLSPPAPELSLQIHIQGSSTPRIEKSFQQMWAEAMVRTGHQYVVLKQSWPTKAVMEAEDDGDDDRDTRLELMEMKCYGPEGYNGGVIYLDGFGCQEDAIAYAKKEVRDKCEFFKGYEETREEEAALDWNNELLLQSTTGISRHCHIFVMRKTSALAVLMRSLNALDELEDEE